MDVLLKQGYLGNPSFKYLYVLVVVSVQTLRELYSVTLVLQLDTPFTLEVEDHSHRNLHRKQNTKLYIHPYYKMKQPSYATFFCFMQGRRKWQKGG